MNQPLFDQLAEQHVTDLRRSAATSRIDGPGGPARMRRFTIRNRVGLALVHIGQRLAAD